MRGCQGWLIFDIASDIPRQFKSEAILFCLHNQSFSSVWDSSFLHNIIRIFQEGSHSFVSIQHCSPISWWRKGCFDSDEGKPVVKLAWAFLKRKLNPFDWKPFVKLCFLQHVLACHHPSRYFTDEHLELLPTHRQNSNAKKSSKIHFIQSLQSGASTLPTFMNNLQ